MAANYRGRWPGRRRGCRLRAPGCSCVPAWLQGGRPLTRAAAGRDRPGPNRHTAAPEFLLRLGGWSRVGEAPRSARLQRAIGVTYRPQTKRQSHYLRGRLADQYDAVIHVDETQAVEPLERTARWEEGEVPETYPFAV
jgi:Erythromycin esterase